MWRRQGPDRLRQRLGPAPALGLCRQERLDSAVDLAVFALQCGGERVGGQLVGRG